MLHVLLPLSGCHIVHIVILYIHHDTQEFEVGAIYPAVVKEVRDYGLIVELAPGVDLLLHKSQMSHKFVSKHEPAVSLTYYTAAKTHCILRNSAAFCGQPPDWV